MEVKITIWVKDDELEELTEDFKVGVKDNMTEWFSEVGATVKQIEIEESQFEGTEN